MAGPQGIMDRGIINAFSAFYQDADGWRLFFEGGRRGSEERREGVGVEESEFLTRRGITGF